MALPTQVDLLRGGYSAFGQPFAAIEAKNGLDTMTGGYSAFGQPFMVPSARGVTGSIVAIDGVPYGSVVKVNGVAVAAIQKINGVVAQT